MKMMIKFLALFTLLFASNLIIANSINSPLDDNYTFNGTGNWSDASKWTPSVPPTNGSSSTSISINGNCTLDVDFTLYGNNFEVKLAASLTIQSGITLTVPFGKFCYNDGTLTNNGTITIESNGNLNRNNIFTNNGTLNVNGFLTLPNGSMPGGTFNWQSQGKVTIYSLTNTSILTIPSGGSLNVSVLTNNADLYISGTLVMKSTTISGTNNIIVNATGVFAIDVDGFTIPSILQWNAANSKVKLLTSRNMTLTDPFTLSSGQVFEVENGATLINQNNFNSSGGIINYGTITNEGVLVSSGTISGSGVFNGSNLITTIGLGIINPNTTSNDIACLAFNSGITQTNSNIHINIHGATDFCHPLTGFDRINVIGNANIGGTLNVSLGNSYTPSGGETFNIISATSINGTFSTINYPVVSGITWSITYNSNSIVLNATSTPLPVELIEFSAKNTKEGILLNWETASETNSKCFILERSYDYNKNWLKIVQIETNKKPSKYEHLDINPLKTLLYRLRLIDNDGKESLSKVISVIQDDKNNLIVFPNPTTGKLYLSENDKLIKYSVFNNLGQLLLESNTSSEIDISTIPRGIYQLQILIDSIKIDKRIIKN